MRVECHDMGKDTAEREGLGRLAERVDKRVIPCGAVFGRLPEYDADSIGLFSLVTIVRNVTAINFVENDSRVRITSLLTSVTVPMTIAVRSGDRIAAFRILPPLQRLRLEGVSRKSSRMRPPCWIILFPEVAYP